MAYVGETSRIVKFGFAEHRGYVNISDDTATGEHFNLPGMMCTERRGRNIYIRKFNTYYKGLNKQT